MSCVGARGVFVPDPRRRGSDESGLASFGLISSVGHPADEEPRGRRSGMLRRPPAAYFRYFRAPVTGQVSRLIYGGLRPDTRGL